jgi:gamma-hexachlorocyclohexane dehydrochlorinase
MTGSTLDLADQIDRLNTRFALQDLVSDYCHGFDKRDCDRFLAIWWEDCIWDIGPPFGSFEGHAGIRTAVHEVLWPAWDLSTHFTTNLRVAHESRDRASGVCDVYCIGNTSDGQAQTIAATYADQFERRSGTWKIRERKVTMHHFSPLLGIRLAPPE